MLKTEGVAFMRCPSCENVVDETSGSAVSPYINTYACPACGWTALRCGNSSCDGYLEPEEIGSVATVRYNCVTCGWTGTGARVA
ncbi:MAG: hypothetical protein ACXVQW_13110 [Actinomycetota bacterium]